MVLKTEEVSKDPSSGVFEATAPSGATRIELSSGVKFTLPDKTVAKIFAVSIFITAIIPIMKLMHILG